MRTALEHDMRESGKLHCGNLDRGTEQWQP
jgi:hypothetical protein